MIRDYIHPSWYDWLDQRRIRRYHAWLDHEMKLRERERARQAALESTKRMWQRHAEREAKTLQASRGEYRSQALAPLTLSQLRQIYQSVHDPVAKARIKDEMRRRWREQKRFPMNPYGDAAEDLIGRGIMQHYNSDA